MMRSKAERLSGWGRYPAVDTHSFRPERIQHAQDSLECMSYGIPRGLGRSYGDASLNSNAVIRMERLNRLLHFDPKTGRLSCEAGTTLDELLDVFVPRGWFVPVTPGTRFVTVGGCIACDVHGKDHHQASSFGEHVTWMRLLLASGETIECTPEQHADLFWATVGGMGLTGLILDATIEMKRIPSAWIRSTSIKTKDLDETLAVTQDKDPSYPYSVVWLDALGQGKRLGRSVVLLGEWAAAEDVNEPFAVPKPKTRKLPIDLPSWVLNRWSIGAFNRLYYRLQKEKQALVDYRTYFYPLDAIQDWNRMYGKRGFIQYQFVLPEETSERGLVEILETVAKEGTPSFLTVLKRFGPQGHGLLSFPRSGYTLTLDLAVGEKTFQLAQTLDDLVLKHEGRIYLGKDARLSREAFETMYADRLPDWQSVQAIWNPEGTFRSELSQRLGLTPA